MKRNKFNKTIIGLSTLVVLGSSGIIAASCGNKAEKEKIITTPEKQQILSGQIKYLAIGDDYAAGNNYSNNNFVINGLDEKNNEIKGLSYASYLANSIKELSDEKTTLGSYHNYGLSGSKLDDWLYILNSSKYSINAEIQNNVEYNKSIMNDANSDRFENQFGNFDEDAFSKIKENIRNANFLTISIGLNDFFNDIDLFNHLFAITNDSADYENIEKDLKSWYDSLAIKSVAISQKYNSLIDEIKAINPNVNINLVGYISPYLRLSNILRKQFNNDYIYDGIKILNNLLKKVANDRKINFVSFRDEQSIISSPNKFSADIFEMLPSLAAYKKLAQDIFAKLAIDSSKYNEIIGEISSDSDSTSFRQSILFSKNAEEIKETILGITGDNVDNFITKKYPFEELAENQTLIENENQQKNTNPFIILKAKFNKGKNLDSSKLILYFNTTMKLLGLNLSDLKSTFTELKNDLEIEENRAVFVQFIEEILDNKNLQNNLIEAKSKVNELIDKKSYENIEAKDISKAFREVFLSPDNIFIFIKELSKTDFIKNPIIENKYPVYSELLLSDLLSSNIIKSFLPATVAENLDSIFGKTDFKISLKKVVDSFIANLLSNPDKYAKSENYNEFVNLLINDSSQEIKDFIKVFISNLKNDPELSDSLVSEVSEKIKDVYNLDEIKYQQIKKFIRIFMLNVDDFKNSDKLLDFSLQTLINWQSERSENKTVDKFFANLFAAILTDKYDLNKKHDLLLSLISANLGKTEEEQNDFRKGFEVLSLAYLAKQNIFDSTNIGKLINEKNRKDILSLLFNVIKNENNELNEDGKTFIANISISVLEGEIKDPNSNLNALLKQLTNYFIINPISLGLKTTFGEKINIHGQSVENFVEQTWDRLWENIKSQEIVDNIRSLISKILERRGNYDTSSMYSFISSLVKDAKNNNLINLVDALIKKILASKEVSQNVIDGTFSLLEQSANAKFTEEQKKLISSYFINLLSNLPNSKLYAYVKAKLSQTLERIDQSEVNNFEALGKYIKLEMSELLSFKNQSIIQEIIDIIFIKNANNQPQMPFNEVIKTFSAILGNEEIIDFIVNKINLKDIISNLLKNVKLSANLSIQAQMYIKAILKNFDTFIKDKFDSELLPLLKSLLKNFFEIDANREYQSINELIKDFISKNKQTLKEKSSQLLKSLIASDGGSLKSNISKLMTTLIDDNVTEFQWGKSKESVQSIITKLLDSLSEFNLTNIILDNIFTNLEQNLEANQLKVKEYKFSINLSSLINELNYDTLINFIKKLTAAEAKNVALLVLKNLKYILKSSNQTSEINGSEKPSPSPSSNGKIHFSFSGEIKIPINKLLEIFKVSFEIIKLDDDKKEIKDALKETLNEIFRDQKIKEFIKEKLQTLINRLSSKEDLTNKLLNKILAKLVDGIFENDKYKTLITKISEWFIDLNTEKMKNFRSFDDVIKTFLENNQTTIVDLFNELINDQISNNEHLKELIGLGLEYVAKRYKLSLTNIKYDDLKSLLAKIIKGLGGADIVKSLAEELLNKLKDIKLFDNNSFDEGKALENIKEKIMGFDFWKMLSKDNFEKVLSSIIKGDDKITSQELFSLYEYLKELLPKLQSVTNASPVEVQAESSEKLEPSSNVNLEKIIVDLINVLNKILKDEDNKVTEFKNTVVETINMIIKDQAKNLDYSKIKNNFISEDTLKKIFEKLSNYEEINILFKDLISDFSKYEANREKLGDIIEAVLSISKDNLTKNINKIISKISKDNDIKPLLIDELFRYLSLENTTEEDKIFVSDLIDRIVVRLQDHPFYKKKIIDNLVDKLTKNSQSFSITNPLGWILESLTQFSSIISLNDLAVLGQFIGENNVINGETLVKLINLVLGKSKNPDSVVYKLLSNLNVGDKRTTMKDLNDYISSGAKSALSKSQGKASEAKKDENDIKFSVDPLALINTVIRLLAQEVTKEGRTIQDYNSKYEIRYNKPAYQATYRLLVTLKLVVFEMFGRETLESAREKNLINLYSGSRALLWEIQEGTNLKLIPFIASKFSGMQYYFTNTDIRREFTNYLRSYSNGFFGIGATYTYYQENDYDPSSIEFIINTSGYNENEKNKLKEFGYIVDANNTSKRISKKEYILLTIKEGGYAKFMKLNKITNGSSSWSGTKKIDFSKLN
ncbi:hypothetical protein HGG64_02305 [Mycoplasma phocoeninasale]|uniref:SGNH hydrolase-type esterase domain-containing protein n=1 Tax=Mycoplasma phocoeninasale TaxID=2726117 RepID=A0A858U283_9MOLU|nr:hypothetical protein [Mycoplasma phocoeninasale]QJG66522.1 hypothetical protein HGG64_02305 [Mycoplasma phocoeninasale]